MIECAHCLKPFMPDNDLRCPHCDRGQPSKIVDGKPIGGEQVEWAGPEALRDVFMYAFGQVIESGKPSAIKATVQTQAGVLRQIEISIIDATLKN